MNTVAKVSLPTSSCLASSVKDVAIQGLAVLRPEKFIVCIPTQIGCPIHCKFCNAAPFKRNLTFDEICLLIDHLKTFKRSQQPALLSFMGVGEPSLNLKTVKRVIKAKQASFERFAISTCGQNPDVFTLHHDIKIQLSLNAADDGLRSWLMPKAPPIRSVLQKVAQLTNYDINYVLIDGINDGTRDANALAALLKEYFPKPKVKINKYNETNKYFFQPSENIRSFCNQLWSLNVEVEYYETDGNDVKGACGQMT